MARDPQQARILELFADILDYPAPGLAEKATECEALLRARAPAAASLLVGFRRFAEATPLGHAEEIYSGFFDLNPVCHPYVGYQIFGENYKRSSFLLELKQHYDAEAFQPGTSDMADRLSIVLRFLARSHRGSGTDDLVREGLLPALERMAGRSESGHDHPDGPADFDGDTGIERRQLDGHSHGEVLAGGFLLERSAGDDRSGAAAGRSYAYRHVLQSLRAALQQTWRA